MSAAAPSHHAPGSSSESAVDRTGPRAADPTLPAVFGRYLLIQRLSRGGMGEIFLAKHGLAGFEKLCVIKKVLPSLSEDDQFISRFIDEAQVAIKLQHVNVAQVFEVGRVGDEYFLALEYVEGRDLRRTLTFLQRQNRRFPPDLALLVGREMASGLAYAHRRTSSDGASLQLVHCDISPPNVVVSFEGETKIIDFGIAKSAMRATATDPKIGFGKFGYMAPEQLVRGGAVDARTDIYATGVVLYELLTGQRLYDVGDSPDYRALARLVVKGEHRLPSHTDLSLGRFDPLVARALRPKADDRFQTAAELRDAIQAAVVALNPTLSIDGLGEFMRELFAGEMAQQRELLDRAAAAHLADFEHQLTNQSAATVSFALANLPDDESKPGPSSHRLRISSKVVPASAPDAVAARGRRRRRGVAAVVLFACAGLAVGLAIALTRPARRAAVATSDPGGRSSVRVGASSTVADAGLAAVEPETEIEMPAEIVMSPDPERPIRDLPPRRGRGPKHGDPLAVPDADILRAKFQAATREYKEYTGRMGPRLESEWTDVASMVGFLSTPEKRIAFDQKIDRFRARMRE